MEGSILKPVLPGGLGEDPFAQKGSQKEIGGIETFGVSRPQKGFQKGPEMEKGVLKSIIQ